MSYLPAILCATFMLAAFVAERKARKREESALDHVRDATTAYRDAVQVRKESYRLMALMLRATNSPKLQRVRPVKEGIGDG